MIMVVQVIEGKLVRIVEDGDVDEILKELKNFTGYVKLSIKRDGDFEEGYIFLKNGVVIGYYYNYKDIEAFGERAKEYIEKMKKDKPLIEVYEYTLEKLNTMMEIYREIFIREDKEKTGEVEGEEDEENLHYYDIVLMIPEGKPLRMNVGKDYREYLEGCTLVEIYKKDEEGYKKGYVVYKDKTPILAAYECNGKVLFGKEACKMIKKLLESPDIVVDIFEYNRDKVRILLEYYPQMALVDNIKSMGQEEGAETTEEETEGETAEEEEIILDKEELLKKLNVTLPDEESIENIIKSIFEPSYEELEGIRKDLEEKIVSYLKNCKEIEDFKVDLEVYYREGYYCNCKIKIKPASLFKLILYRGRLFKSIDGEKIKKDIEDIISQYVIDIHPNIEVEIV
ncbi:MAG TPA: DUF2226 domain-containing protein [Methanococcaceae archaeon]|uniref:DUF2226 domain-containing protein n=2 Tax=Methanothermococcus okinawensis TaxID=155863 RepID=A0A832ZJM8_9EURY|nr:DUF2226 domain-containing protein [Methanococcaceae archaeon]HIP90687.1 DUF2226 domain-containing protein [Methanothermococcus okinawensis]